MHDIEPYIRWRNYYIAAEDAQSPFHGATYSEFIFSNKVYNYYIHPQWDHFGSETLYLKVLYADYLEGFTIIEMIGEWNDCINNDIMYLKREVVDLMQEEGIHKFILICENVLNFHAGDDDYYMEWAEEVQDDGGWICLINTLEHVRQEMEGHQLHFHLNLGNHLEEVNWRPHKPKAVFQVIDGLLRGRRSELPAGF